MEDPASFSALYVFEFFVNDSYAAIIGTRYFHSEPVVLPLAFKISPVSFAVSKPWFLASQWWWSSWRSVVVVVSGSRT